MLALYGNLELVHKFYFSLQRAPQSTTCRGGEVVRFVPMERRSAVLTFYPVSIPLYADYSCSTKSITGRTRTCAVSYSLHHWGWRLLLAAEQLVG